VLQYVHMHTDASHSWQKSCPQAKRLVKT
jgi:hypothetical protein